MTGKIFEINGVIPNREAAKTLELVFYGDDRAVWDGLVKKRLEEKYGVFSLRNLPDKDVFKYSKKVEVLGGEKANICYDPKKLLLSGDIYEILTYGIDHEEQPSEISKLTKEIAIKNKISEGDVIICPDHALGVAIQMHGDGFDTIIDYDNHEDRKEYGKYARSSWAHHLANNFKTFGFEEKPKIVHTKSRLTEDELSMVKENVALTVCLDVLQPTYADAILNLRKDGGMHLEDLMKDIEILQKRTNITSLSVCERRRVLDDGGSTSPTIRRIVQEFMKN